MPSCRLLRSIPDIAFALLNGAENTPGEAVNGNVSSLLPNAQQIGWIAGALAGLMTESGKLGFIGGMELDTTKGKIAGFEEAAKYVGRAGGQDRVELLDVPYANSFSDAPKGKEFATELISQGADVFFGDASAVDSGAREAIDAANAASRLREDLRHRPARRSSWARMSASSAPRSPITPP